MTATTLDNVVSLRKVGPRDRVAAAAVRVYDAEVALHIARQTGVDSWVAAAYDRLHEAMGTYLAAQSHAFRPARRAG
jgi:hypothetical protein